MKCVDPGKTITRKEICIAIALFVVIFLPITYIQSVEYSFGFADNAFLDELLVNIAQTGKPTSQINASVYELFGFIAMEPDKVLAGTLDGPHPPEINQFEKHTYFILYLIAPLTYLLPGFLLIPGLKTLSFLGVLLFVYFYLRRERTGILSAILVSLLISAHPAWSLGLYWQMYVDRLFLPCGLFFLYQLTRETPHKIWLSLAALLCLSLVDRTGLICGVAVIGFSVLHPRRFLANKYYYSSLALVMIGLSLFFIKVILNNRDYQSFSSSFLPMNFLATLVNRPEFATGVLSFLLVNLGLFGLLGLGNWRAYLVAVGIMFPNIMGDIGGAEKTGWSTHYHSTYFPFLVWAVITGYVNLARRMRSNTRKKTWLCTLNLMATILLLLPIFLYPSNVDSLKLSTNNIRRIGLVRTFRELDYYLADGHLYKSAQERQMVADAIPTGATVSTLETFLPVLHQGRSVHLYPEGVDIADYVVLSENPEPDKLPQYIGAINYLGKAAQEKLNIGLMTRLTKLGFDLENPIKIGSWVILAKK